jgi:hypothetical protein
LPAPDIVIAPPARLDCQGKYLSPFTQDGTVSLWVDKAVNVKTGAVVGKTIGAYAGQQAASRIPYVGGILGSVVGSAVGAEVGRQAAIKSCGGWNFIRSTSDMSFDSRGDMAVYLYATYAGKNEHYSEAITATYAIYPDVKKCWHRAIASAPRRQQP